jgi:hypothetical protein
MSDYTVVLANEKEIDAILIGTGLNLTAFVNPCILRNFIDGPIDWWLVSKGKSPRCLWPIYPANNEGTLPPFTYNFGPIWLSKRVGTKVFSETMLTYNLFFEKFSTYYKSIVFELSIEDTDVRFFDWYGNYQKKARVVIYPRYTARIEELNSKTSDELIASFSELRRRQLRKFANYQDRFTHTSKVTCGELLGLYAETLSVNENAIPANIKSSVQKLAQMQSGKYFRLDALRLKVNNELAALTLLIEDGKTANLVFNLVAREFREFGIMTHMVTNAILLSRDLDLETFDFNGANSPNRALDKHSYGSRQVLFFRIQVDW